jgi:hypothetical protein
MPNPTFFQITAREGEMHLGIPPLDGVDGRKRDDLGLSEEEWTRTCGNHGARVLFVTALRTARQLFHRRAPGAVHPAC